MIVDYKEYDPETYLLALDAEPPEELLPLRAELLRFLKSNARYWNKATLAKFLGIDQRFFEEVLPPDTKFNTHRAHTVLILQPIEAAEIDEELLREGKI